jgi:hypothetical protein
MDFTDLFMAFLPDPRQTACVVATTNGWLL